MLDSEDVVDEKPLKIRTHTRSDNDTIIWSKNIGYEQIISGKSKDSLSPGQVTIINMGKMLSDCVKEGEISKVKELISRGAPFTVDWLGMTALHFAAMNNHLQICDILLRGGINKDARTKVDRSPLHLAAYEGHDNIVELLINRGCFVDIKDMLRMTPLHWAVEKRHKKIVRLLLKAGADVTALSKFDKTPLSIAYQTGQMDIAKELEDARVKQESKRSRNDQLLEKNQMETNSAVKSIIPKSERDDSQQELTTSLRKEQRNKVTEGNSKNPQSHNKKISYKLEKKGDFNYSIEQLENMDDEDKKHLDQSAIELLKSHGISMMDEESVTTVIESALQSGRQLVLSEAGKYLLNETKLNNNSFEERSRTRSASSSNKNNPNSSKDEEKQIIIEIKESDGKRQNHSDKPRILNKGVTKNEPIFIRAKSSSFKQSKNVKIISVETCKKMNDTNAGDLVKTVSSERLLGNRLTPMVTKVTKIQNSSATKPTFSFSKSPSTGSGSIKSNQATVRILPVQKSPQDFSDDELPPNIEICNESDAETDEYSIKMEKIESKESPSSNKEEKLEESSSHFHSIKLSPTGTNNNSSLTLSELNKQMSTLRREVADLRKQLEITQRVNIQSKIKIEKLEYELNRLKNTKE